MRSQDLIFLRPSLSKALNSVSFIVPIQAPDRTFLPWESCVFSPSSNHSSRSGVFGSTPQSHGLTRDVGRHPLDSYSATLSPNPWSWPSQPGRPVKVKTTSGKQEQWNGDNFVFLMLFLIKENPVNPPLLCLISLPQRGRLSNLTFSGLDETFSGFLGRSGCSPKADVFHIQQRFGSILDRGNSAPFSGILS